MSASLEVGSDGSTTSRAIFEPSDYYIHENDKEKSLIVLSNCVFLTNATILRRRKILPACYFESYPVFKDIRGYTVNDETREGAKLKAKLNAVNIGIQASMIRQLAIVVEKEFNTEPVEAFVWTFSYSDSDLATAQIGYNGNTASFAVNYRDMVSTEQQFCRLFSELEKILGSLDPVPNGHVPSLKIAYRGDPNEELVKFFTPVDNFIDLEWNGIGSAAFPHQRKLYLKYSSIFKRRQARESTVEAVEENMDDSVSNMENYEFEAPRQNRTMEVNEEEDREHSRRSSKNKKSPTVVDNRESPKKATAVEVDVASIAGNVGSHPDNVLQSELVANRAKDKELGEKLRSSVKKSGEKRRSGKVAFEEFDEVDEDKFSHSKKKSARCLSKEIDKLASKSDRAKMDGKKTTHGEQPKSSDSRTIQKASRRLSSEMIEDNEEPEPIPMKKKANRRLQPELENDVEEERSGDSDHLQKKESTMEIPEMDTSPETTFDNNSQPIFSRQSSGSDQVRRFARVSGIVHCVEEISRTPIRFGKSEEISKIGTDERDTTSSKFGRYGEISSRSVGMAETPKKFGRSQELSSIHGSHEKKVAPRKSKDEHLETQRRFARTEGLVGTCDSLDQEAKTERFGKSFEIKRL